MQFGLDLIVFLKHLSSGLKTNLLYRVRDTSNQLNIDGGAAAKDIM
jgi:hypothetical protein